ncbi:dihydroanticapsin 7-dehydrogenase-like [Clavelina lepadiformis]|uniref:dihydroanticapsin 7-dehydrogenase-like n=1 Tax=Clavelina lepadiformis TaxID=159417 RepID=UPI0040429968
MMDNPEFHSKNQPPLDQEFTKNRFKDKVVVVTGGASGIGFAVAERFANDGAVVAIADMDRTNGAKAVERIKAEGHDNVKFYFVNVADKSSCTKAVEEVAGDNDGVIHCLVNSAAFFGSSGLKSEPADWRKSCDVNIMGAASMVQACHPYLVKANGAAIVNLASASALRAQPERWTYSATKGAIITMTKNMALDLGKDQIRVNSISPAWVWSPVQAKASVDGSQESMPAVADFSIKRRAANTSEIAAVTVFLCSRDASYMTGTNVIVDGGYCAIGPERLGDQSLFAGEKS